MAYLGENIRKLGFGLMRLPREGREIDVEQVKVMVDRFLSAGFTYFDTAWAYAGSEDAIRQALVERYPRESYQLATKNAAWIKCRTREDAIRQFDESLRRTGAGYFDFYLLHNLGEGRTQLFEDFDLWRFVQEKKAEGLIRHIGFSFHSTPEALEEVLQKHPEAEFVQLQINYSDWDSADVQSRRCYEVARRYSKSVIVMEPVKGGMLANPPQVVRDIFREAEPESSCASWAIRFAADLEGVITVLSGMSSVEQMEDNLATMSHFTHLSESERAALDKAREAIRKMPLIQCTGCNYCAKVCPNDIGVSGAFAAYNHFVMYGDAEGARRQFNHPDHRGHAMPAACARCGECEEACPQHLHIRDLLEKVSETLGV